MAKNPRINIKKSYGSTFSPISFPVAAEARPSKFRYTGGKMVAQLVGNARTKLRTHGGREGEGIFPKNKSTPPSSSLCLVTTAFSPRRCSTEFLCRSRTHDSLLPRGRGTVGSA